MPPDPQPPTIPKAELLAQLGEAASATARLTVVTPNARLAAALLKEFNDWQGARGVTAWESADILPFGAFVARLHEDGLYSDGAARRDVPVLLTAGEEQHLWQDIIEQSPWGPLLLSGGQAAARCRDAWRLAHAWRIAGALAASGGAWLADEQAEDARAFAQWSQAYAARTARELRTDAARLPDVVANLLHEPFLRLPAHLAGYAFDIVTPQQQAFFAACRGAGVRLAYAQPDRVASEPLRLPFTSAREELETAARWARQRLERAAAGEAPRAPRIAVVVPDLEARRKEVLRVFSRVLDPQWGIPVVHDADGAAAGPAAGAPPFNVSLGEPLAAYPVVADALALLELGGGELDYARVSRLLRSPFIGDADVERDERAALDAALRERVAPRLRLPALLRAMRRASDPERRQSAPACPQLTARLERMLDAARSQLGGSRSPHDWARRYSELLIAAGFPGERTLDSAEYQTLAKWRDTLGELARLERVAPRLSHAQALARLRRLCRDTLFQPRMAAEGGEAPIQVLGILESAGLEFDHLWVSGLTEEAWPLAARPDPFLPLALQRKAGIPQATAESALELDQRITAEWCGSAPEVVLSHPLIDGERELLPSPLVARIEAGDAGALGVPAPDRLRDRIFSAGRDARQPFADERAPAYAAAEVRGGTRVLTDQAACPFRAFARHRLMAEPLASPAAGLDAAQRGQLLHMLFARIWRTLGDREALVAKSAEELSLVIADAAQAAVQQLRAGNPDLIGERFAALECRRLARLARDWLDIERARADFSVVALEDPRTLHAGGLAFRGRIDRMDRLADGSHALIDYKAGQARVAGWLGARPDDPQLPLYAANAGERIGALAFARLRSGDMRFEGLAREDGLLPGVPAVENHRQAKWIAPGWSELLAGWRAELDALGEGFAVGDARVDPKTPLTTCQYCSLQPLCRVRERFGALNGADETPDAVAEVPGANAAGTSAAPAKG